MSAESADHPSSQFRPGDNPRAPSDVTGRCRVRGEREPRRRGHRSRWVTPDPSISLLSGQCPRTRGLRTSFLAVVDGRHGLVAPGLRNRFRDTEQSDND